MQSIEAKRRPQRQLLFFLVANNGVVFVGFFGYGCSFQEPMAQPNRELEEFLNGAPMPGTSWGDEDEEEKQEEPHLSEIWF